MPKKKPERLNLEDWCDRFAAVDRSASTAADSASAWLRFVENATTRIAELVRREEHDELLKSLGYALGWLCSFVRFYSESRSKEAFHFVSPLSQMIWRKYPGVCYRCTHKFALKDMRNPTYLSCVCLATPSVSEQEKHSRERNLAAARKNKSMPSTFDGWADMIRTIYGPNHRELSMSGICLHFLEEVGEVAKALRQLREQNALTDIPRKQQAVMELEEEIADVLSWILGLLNKLDQILGSSRLYYRKASGADLPHIRASQVAWNALEAMRRKRPHDV